MTEGYLQIMIESLEKKIGVLDKIMELNVKQAEISSIGSRPSEEAASTT